MSSESQTDSAPSSQPTTSTSKKVPLSSYSCPVCFSPPTNATIVPCGHMFCGMCLFMSVKAGVKRGGGALCPVCRAVIVGWDGKGGGVVGLQPRWVVPLDEDDD